MKLLERSFQATKQNKNIHFLRILAMIAVLAVSVLLLVYSFYFLHVYQVYHSTTSYFPWRYHVTYTSASSVSKLFYLGVGASLFGLFVSCAVLFLSMRRFRTRVPDSTVSVFDPKLSTLPSSASSGHSIMPSLSPPSEPAERSVSTPKIANSKFLTYNRIASTLILLYSVFVLATATPAFPNFGQSGLLIVYYLFVPGYCFTGWMQDKLTVFGRILFSIPVSIAITVSIVSLSSVAFRSVPPLNIIIPVITLIVLAYDNYVKPRKF